MKSLPPYRLFLFFLSLFTSLLFASSGCVMKTEKCTPVTVVVQDEELQREHEELKADFEKQKQLNARLQMSLLDKHAEVNKLMLKNEQLVRVFVRNKVKLRNRGNKVEAVRLLAEVTTVIDAARVNNPDGNWDEVLDRAEQFLKEGREEIDKGNLEKFFYLASKAFEQVQMIELENREVGQRIDESESIFLVPLSMKLLLTSNVRRGPSMDAEVDYVLEAGSLVTAIGYKGMWVKVNSSEQDGGWIHNSLLSGVDE